MEHLRERIEELRNEVIIAAAEVSAAIEADEERVQLDAGKTVDSVVQKYQALLAEAGDARDKVEIQLGRRITDLRRSAAELVQRASGSKTDIAHDVGQPFILSRKPGRSITPERDNPLLRGGRLSVGSEVDSWCGKCKEMRTHNVVALAGGEPRQVVCATCHSRHNFKPAPPERARGAAPTTGAAVKRTGGGSVEDRRKEDQRRQLQKELADAVDPKTFDPKARYRAGEIIVHPEHGRGKIENVLRTSLLVRFLDGLRLLDLS
jgi:hypothetical protein